MRGARALRFPKKKEGAEHDQVFHIRCQLVDMEIETEGVGKNRKLAEQAAAAKALPIALAKLKGPKCPKEDQGE